MTLCHRLSLILLAVIAIGGCGSRDRTAEKYAEKLADVLKAYEEQLDRKIAAEKASYEHLRATHLEAFQEDVLLSLRLEREDAAAHLGDEQLRRGERDPFTRTEILDRVRAYAESDYDKKLTLLDDEISANERYLEDIEALDKDAKKIKDLTTSLNALAKPKSQGARIAEIVAFGKKVNEEYRRLECAQLTQQIDLVNKRLSAATTDDEKERLKKQVAALEERLKNCPKDEK